MPVWNVLPINQEPSTTLVRWQVIELPHGDRHLVGYAVEAREGRVCSAVKLFDVRQLRATTRSGRVYQLRGTPGLDSEGEYVWRRWASINKESKWSDVTALVYAEHKEALSDLRPAAESDAPGQRPGDDGE
jgi:hypothetical protein